MRIHRSFVGAKNGRFLAGLVVGLAGAGVAFAAIGAGRRRRARPEKTDDRLVIDGARAADPIALSVQPGTEANSSGPAARLESEVVDVSPLSQRW